MASPAQGSLTRPSCNTFSTATDFVVVRSARPGIIECMFEGFGPRELVDVMGSAARAESAAIARRLEAVAALFGCRDREYAEAGFVHTDVYEAVGAEVSAAQNISGSRARNQVQLAVSLYTRLPKVAEAFGRGDVDFRMVQMVLSRTQNVEEDVIGALDAAIAPRLSRWMRLSKNKLRDRVDLYVADFDPAAVRVPPVAKDNRYFDVMPDVPGMAFVGGVLNARDAAALDQRLEAIAATVCGNDPRSHNNLRADAAGALGRGESALACECGTGELCCGGVAGVRGAGGDSYSGRAGHGGRYR